MLIHAAVGTTPEFMGRHNKLLLLRSSLAAVTHFNWLSSFFPSMTLYPSLFLFPFCFNFYFQKIFYFHLEPATEEMSISFVSGSR